MELNSIEQEVEVEEEAYVMLDLDSVSGLVDIPPNAPYVLSGLDTLNPVLVIGDNLKLIGEYEETIGTCIVFSEEDVVPEVHEETGPSDANLFSGKFIVDPNQTPKKIVKPLTSLNKVLKFRLAKDDHDDNENKDTRDLSPQQNNENKDIRDLSPQQTK